MYDRSFEPESKVRVVLKLKPRKMLSESTIESNWSLGEEESKVWRL